MAQSSDKFPILAGDGSPIEIFSLRRGTAARVAEFAVLLLRASAIVLLLSPVFVAAALLLD